MSEPIGQTLPLADCYYMMSVAFQRVGQLDSAMKYVREDLRLNLAQGNSVSLRVAASFVAYGDMKRMSGDLDSASVLLNRALSIARQAGGGETPFALMVMVRLGATMSENGDFREAIAAYDSAAVLARRCYGDDHIFTAGVYASLGEAYSQIGELRRASDCVRLAIRRYLSHYGAHHSHVARLYDILANNYLAEDSLSSASDVIREAIALQESLFVLKTPVLGKMYETQGLVLQRQGEHRDALASFESSREIFARVGKSSAASLINILVESATSLEALGMSDSAMANLRNVLEFYQKGSAFDSRQLSQVYAKLAHLEEVKGEDSTAFDFYDQALAAARGDGASGRAVVHPQEYLAAGLAKIRLLERIGASRSREENARLVGLCHEMIGVVEQTRLGMREEDSKITFSHYALPFCEKGIDACIRLWKSDCLPEYKDSAFAFAEYSKGRVLLESLDRDAALRVSGIADSTRARERTLLRDLASLDVLLSSPQYGIDSTGSSRRMRLEARRLGCKQDLLHLDDSLMTAVPTLQGLLKSPGTLDVQEIHSSIPQGSTLVEYFHGDSSIYAFVIHAGAIDIVELGSPKGLERLASRYLESIRTIEPGDYIRTSRALYVRLVSPLTPLIKGSTHLIIVPEWTIAAIPFEALLSRPVGKLTSGESLDFAKMPYLVRQYDISYAYSAAFFAHEQHRSDASSGIDGIIAFAPAFGTRGDASKRVPSAGSHMMGPADGTLPALTHTAGEVRAIATLFRRAGKKAETYIGNNATKPAFQRAVTGYSYIHVATHGIVNSEDARLSALTFSDVDDTPVPEHSFLYGEEAYNLGLDARLVVLSSCESGTGKAVRGEGLLALTRGFFHAGARNVVCSLWKVLDATTEELMVDFYGNALGGRSFARSIRQAKLRLIGSPSTSFPREWAGFVLIGM